MAKQSTRACIYWIQLCLERGCCIQLAPIPQDMGVKQKTLCLSDKSFYQVHILRPIIKREQREG